jgi:nicotinate-nucleotide pyrophosphorylase (carboxylating)
MTPRFAPPPAESIARDVSLALAEDLGAGDVTAALLPDDTDCAYLLCKESAVVCGRPWFDACHRALDPDVRIDWRVAEGDRVDKGTVLATLQGRTRALVSAERASLNFLQTLSGTATTPPSTSRPSPAPGPGSSTRARRSPACAWRRSTPCAWAAASITASACSTR